MVMRTLIPDEDNQNPPFFGAGTGPAAPPYVRTDQPNSFDAGFLQTFLNSISIAVNLVVGGIVDIAGSRVVISNAVDSISVTVGNIRAVLGDILADAGQIRGNFVTALSDVNATRDCNVGRTLNFMQLAFGVNPDSFVNANVTPFNLASTDGSFVKSTVVGNCTINLPAAPLFGQTFWIKDTTFNAAKLITINGNGKTIDGAATFGLLVTSVPFATILIYDGTQWFVFITSN